MESVGTLLAGEWNSFNGMSNEEADFMAQLLGSYSYSNEQDAGLSLGNPSSTFWANHESSMNIVGGGDHDQHSYYCSDTANHSNLYYLPQETNNYSSRSSAFVPISGVDNYNLSDSNPALMTNDSSMSLDFHLVDEHKACSLLKVFPDDVMEETACLKEEINNGNAEETDVSPTEEVVPSKQKVQTKRKPEIQEPDLATEDNTTATNTCPNPRKKSRGSSDVQKNKKSANSKKNQKNASTGNGEEETNAALTAQSSSSCSSEDDSNGFQELAGGETTNSKKSSCLNSSGKTRASRGSATDPQSLYARKRRERINERLRILQNLVPNGTKVDISTMLEEAVQYVKFLQLQIKLLSSDDLWMYAPIAYNGMDIGLDLNR